LKAYLHCPYRYYLERVLGMQPVSPPGREVDAMQFGNLVHRALQAFGQDEDARRLTDQRRIAQYLESGIRKLAAADFGRRPPPLVTLQLESAIRRLAAFANAEAKSRAEGWEILACELNLGAITEPERQLKIGSTRLNGIVDRVERNRATGKVRILDFKTSETAKDPAQAHLKSPRQIPADSEWRLGPQDAKGRATVWIDLQLPLYAAAVGRLEYGEVTSVAYGCLAAAVSVIQIMPWANFDRAVVDSALACAEKAVARITDGIFWPMGDSPLYSDNPLEEILSTSTPQPPGNPN
jgi:ATP-dependent helicase/nuclease subunit B